jgi:glycosyltransferase involved in cell wall biosynthesis
MTNPLITLCVFTYNGEAFVKEAVESALNQTYSQLQIIISDDNSLDNTFNITEKIVGNYNGKHQVLLNRNQVNLGIREHFNKVISLAKGEYIVLLAGDDIAKPDRVERSVEIIKKYKPALITSNVVAINSKSEQFAYKFNFSKDDPHFLNTTGYIDADLDCRVITHLPLNYINSGWPGAPFTFKKDILKLVDFRLPETVAFEDNFISFLAYLQGSFVYSYNPLICYRIHDKSYSSLLTNKDNLNMSSTKWITEFNSIAIAKRDVFLRNTELKKYERYAVLNILNAEILKNDLKLAALKGLSDHQFKLQSVSRLLSLECSLTERMKFLFMILFPAYVKRHEERNTLKRA